MSEETHTNAIVNTEDRPKITTVKKHKDPKRVEAGRRLAQISQKAREEKIRRKIESESKKKNEGESWDVNYGYIVGFVGLACALGSLYYARRGDIRETKRLETIKEEPELEHVVIERSHNQKLDSL